MGCDIHMAIEYQDDTLKPGRWELLVSPDHHVWRDYGLFGILAGVRRDVEPVVPPRGWPEDASSGAIEHFTMRVGLDDDGASCAPEAAEKYIKRFGSRWWGEGQTRITNPDWHTPSWLTLEEAQQVLARLRAERHESFCWQFGLLVGCMEACERNGRKSRMVIWFDN